MELEKSTQKVILSLNIECKTGSKIARKLNITIGVVAKELRKLETHGFITIERIGRNNICSYTEKGLRLKWHLIQIKKLESR